MKRIVWGVLSTAKIGMNKVIPALLKSDQIRVKGIGSRNLVNAQQAVAALGLEQAYGAYEELLADPEIEVIYNPLPNHLHVPMTLAAARAGKHVLCEKPMALNAAEIDALCDVKDVYIQEAFMVRHSLQWIEARRLIRDGAIGRPQMIQSYFSYDNLDPGNIRNKVEWGGGGLLDIGCYPVVAGRFFFDAEPVRVMALIKRHETFGTDVIASALLDFGHGRQLSFTVSTQAGRSQSINVFGTKARLSLPIPFNQPPDRAQHIVIDNGATLDGGTAVTHTLPPADQYQLMGEAFCRAVRGEAPLPYGLDDARANMRILDALFRSETSGQWEEVAA
ncbi:oxidoreductase family, NAD-binding Rossmann fold family protein [Asticcacaulis biprosthecium C19]|uniref:Oxidoreductase family, NAD-binding Rossmann fold family protein n=1 Tax=Asticcacaulis biprosthecium C19 TaxID=715226 RepID=F4QMS5_9CAUL|nr:Gfo/Idh/MocA family oxidoreductase [Asticcacaulis biprosthecium]EGF91516.1 oxidoreductase family, NAD-binding Rossmann fold family protein [Asticcacaulis biprosthecium C19]